jgi:hypothetical protein
MKYDLSNTFDISKARVRLEHLVVKRAKISMTEFTPKRTIQQNKYLHVCIMFLANELGYTEHEAKVTIKRYFATDGHKWAVYTKGKEMFLKSTSEYNQDEMKTLIEWIRNFALNELNCHIPTSEEYYQNQFDIEKQLGI